MLYIRREKLQLLPEKKILKQEDYCAYLEAEKALQYAYREKDRLIQHASQLCDQLVSDANTQVAALIETANGQADALIDAANGNAAKVVEEANEKSKAILDEAMAKRQQIFEEAKKYYESEAKRGYEKGYATGKAQMTQQLIEIAGKSSNDFKQLENSIVSLVLKALRRIIGDFDQGELIVRVVRQALKMVKNQREAILKISPQDSQAVRDRLNEILADGFVDYLEITPDSRLAPGTCILETDIGVIDASLEVQLEAIENAFKAAASQQSLDLKDENAAAAFSAAVNAEATNPNATGEVQEDGAMPSKDA
ncbi:MAG: HrpE/YscL family type III secretion apparatus protein [Puniceicoccales bacterium]|jgi:type III secretion protein L|nr:HrpE/YscL family type III secretion apparatus protein [Puniceicoccales bacterium]